MQTPCPSDEVPPGLLESAKAPPLISNRLRTRFEELVGDMPYFVEKMHEVIHREVPAYGQGASPDFLDEVREMTRINMEIWFRVIFEERAPTEQDLRPVAGYARRRYHQGVPLTDLLHSFRSGATTVWQEILLKLEKDPSVQSEMLMSISSYVLQHSDLLGQVLSHSYLDEAHRSQRWRDQCQQEFCEMILDGAGDAERFRQLAEQLGVDANVRRAALLVTPQVALEGEERARLFEELMKWLMSELDLSPDTPHTIRQGQLVVWLPLLAGVNPIDHERQLYRVVSEGCAQFKNFVKRAGIGLFLSGIAGWRKSAEQASRALEWSKQEDRVLCYSEHVLETSVVRDHADRKYFERLLELISEDSVLPLTLEVWLNTPGMTRKAAAASLGIHPNTLDYRLKKIEHILSADLSSMSWLARLYTALRIRGKH